MTMGGEETVGLTSARANHCVFMNKTEDKLIGNLQEHLRCMYIVLYSELASEIKVK